MASSHVDWEIVGIVERPSVENDSKLFNDDAFIPDSLEAYLLDPENCDHSTNHNENNSGQSTHIITRSWVCKLYILSGITGSDLSACMDFLESLILRSPRLSQPNRVFCHLKHLPEILSFPLLGRDLRGSVASRGDQVTQKEESLRETRALIRRCLAHLLSDSGGKPNIILIAGTSGSGKSTVSSYLASFLRVKCVVSTDTIRHVLRSTEKYSQNKALNCSTYEVHKYANVKSAHKDDHTSPESSTVLGYLLQSSIIEKYIYEIITNLVNQEKSVIVEGVHITPSLFERVQSFANSNNANLSTFLIHIQDSSEHLQRFKQRSNGVLSSKYHNNIAEIREIQDYLNNTIGRLPSVTSIDNTSNNIDHIVQEKILKHIVSKFT